MHCEPSVTNGQGTFVRTFDVQRWTVLRRILRECDALTGETSQRGADSVDAPALDSLAQEIQAWSLV